AALTVADGKANHGTILLQSLSTTWAETLATAGTFTNAADGTLLVRAGTGGGRNITGTIINAGTIKFETGAALGGTGANHVNAGLISLAGATVTVTGSSFTNQVGGLITGYGAFNTLDFSLTNQGILDLSPPSLLGVDVMPSSVLITYYDAAGMNAT